MKNPASSIFSFLQKICFLLSLLSFGLFLYLSFQSSEGSLLTQNLITRKMTREEAKEAGKRLIKTHPYGIVQLYAAKRYFHWIRKDLPMALLFIEAIQKGVTPEYGNIQRYKGDICLQLGKISEACDAYMKEAENFPLSVIPVYHLMRIAYLQKEYKKAELLKQNLEARKKARSINEKMFLFILKNPLYDLRPWHIPKSHGGPESERSFKYQKIGTVKSGETF